MFSQATAAICDECEEEDAVRYCKQCEDKYCVACFEASVTVALMGGYGQNRRPVARSN